MQIKVELIQAFGITKRRSALTCRRFGFPGMQSGDKSRRSIRYRVNSLAIDFKCLLSAQPSDNSTTLKIYRINAFTVTLPNDTCFQPFGEG